jgi:hypothetical protein
MFRARKCMFQIFYLLQLHPSVSYFRDRESWGMARAPGIGRGEPWPAGGACWGSTAEVRSVPRVVWMGRARLVILILAPSVEKDEEVQ